MRWKLGAIFFTTYYFAIISSSTALKDVKSTNIDCQSICGTSNPPFNYGTCPCHLKLRQKRQTVKEIMKKYNNKLMKTPLKPLSKRAKLNFQSRISNSVKPKPLNPFDLNTRMQQDFKHRFSELKARLASNPLLGARANFHAVADEDKPNLIEQFKSKKEELMEKLRKANAESLSRLQNRIDIDLPKTGLVPKDFLKSRHNIEDVTTSPSENSSPLIILSSSTTQKVDDNVEDVGETVSTIDKFKEKQKEVVSKIKDKLSATKLI